MEGNYATEQELNVALSLQALKTSVTALSGTQQDVLTMTESNVKALEKEIAKNVTRLLFSMMGLFQ